ncbi:MAG TPA: glycosyltransferase family 2 protein, partial [Polyangiaceae bacterium]|nr:glycosyltransferase family 2 protein [Polyangiaceae bacterium]
MTSRDPRAAPARSSIVDSAGPGASTSESPDAPYVSIVIPVYNEEALLHAAVAGLREQLAELPERYEIVLAENGSTDATLKVLAALSQRHEDVRYISLPTPNYGRALREGIAFARGKIVICEEIDLCDVDFHRRALELLKVDADFVIGSKLISGARDERPWLRHGA